VIPVRDQPQTLPFTLRTCLAQEFDDFEIVLADNQSNAPVVDVLADWTDSRIKHVRTPTPLAMTDSWEFAVRQASGEFVTVVGADDGLLLHALTEIDRLLRVTGATMLRWESACYTWPDLPPQDHARPHELLIPLKQTDSYYPICVRQAAAVIEDAVNMRVSYAELPMIQCSAIHRDHLEQMRARTGRVFGSECPDIYSSFAFALLAGTFHTVAAPMTINGLSGRSNGVACIYLKEQSAIAEEFRRLNRQAKHVRHPHVPLLPVMPAYVADSFLSACAAFPTGGESIALDRKQLVVHCINEARLADETDWARCRATCREGLADDAALLAWFDGEYGSRRLDELTQTRVRLKRYGGSYLHLDASEYGVTNIFEAAQLCDKLLGCKRDGLNCHVVHESAPEPPAPPVQAPHCLGFWQRLSRATQTMLYGKCKEE
jgi:glycosyltransferase involved in cell wall biosynthesis